ncbi:MAG: acetamidase/formamidase family protein [Bifidobacteriaceae bacterium]|jgi:formamidase|nr:acetamidase/formamidase family protein [Bifidobacteriaceae bacterium]
MPETVFPLDSTKRFEDQAIVGHNRWHPDIPPTATVKPGTSIRVHCREWLDGAIHNDDSAQDILDAPLDVSHKLSGPFAVEGAKPGDLLVVDILDIGPIPGEDSGPLAGQGWGYTGIFAKANGGGFLTDEFPDAYKAIWDFTGPVATSRHIPHVAYPGLTHPGLMGTAPSPALLAKWNARENALIATDPSRVPPLAMPPQPNEATLGALPVQDFATAAAEAARTVPPRENGGNQDIKNLSRGSRVFYPVFVDGGNLSVGDLHFSQGDGEITFCGAIEMGGFIDLRLDLIKDGMETYGVAENAIFLPGTADPQFSEWIAFSGVSVTTENEQRYLDSDLAFKRACLHAIDYLTKFGYSPEQAYLLIGSAPVEGRLSGVVDIPNSCATIYLPTAIFDFDVRPSAAGPAKVDPGIGAPHASAR